MRPVQTHAPCVHQHDQAAMEAAKAEEASLQEKGEGETKDKRRITISLGPMVTTPMGDGDEYDDDPKHRDAMHP